MQTDGNSTKMLAARFALAALAGVTLAWAFPRVGIAGFAWVVPGLIALAAADRWRWRTFQFGYVAGLSFWLISLNWLLRIPYPPGAIAGWLALSAFLALFQGAWAWWTWWLWPGSQAPRLWELTSSDLELSWWRRFLWGLGSAAGWTVLEWGRGMIFGGFPWNNLGTSQWRMLPIAQWASVTGVYGVTFLVAWMSMALAATGIRLVHSPSRRWGWQQEILVPLLLVAAIAGWGLRRIGELPVPGEAIRLALIQPSIPQTVIWDPAGQPARFARLMDLSHQALSTGGVDLLVWPEAAMPAFSAENFSAITNLIAAHRVWMVFGADDVDPHDNGRGAGGDGKNGKVYNAGFLFGPDGLYAGRYRKQQLVMFGEYVPLARWLPFLRRLTPIEGLDAGESPVRFQLTTPSVSFAMLICFEDAFPALVRQQARLGVDFLLNLTNDGWFGEGAAQWQQAAGAAFRALENGLPLVRATNNGLTCWIDPWGRIEFLSFDGPKDVYRKGYKIVDLPPPSGRTARGETFYRQWGDWWVAVCGGVCLLCAVCKAGQIPGRLRKQLS